MDDVAWRLGGMVLVLVALLLLGGGLMAEAHGPKPDPPKPGPGRDPNGVDTGQEGQYWYVVRSNRPTVPVYGPFLTPEPECRGYTIRFPGIYRCVRLP